MGARRSQGFSLLEMMAVIFIIGLSLGMVSLAINRGGPRDELWDAMERFMVSAQFASERAILSGETTGLQLLPPMWRAQRGQDLDEIGWRYKWVRETPTGWQDIANLPAVDLPPTTHLTVEINEQLWEYEEQLNRDTPVAAFYPTGDITDIAIEFSDERERGFTQHVEVNENGELEWLEAPKAPEADDNAF